MNNRGITLWVKIATHLDQRFICQLFASLLFPLICPRSDTLTIMYACPKNAVQAHQIL